MFQQLSQTTSQGYEEVIYLLQKLNCVRRPSSYKTAHSPNLNTFPPKVLKIIVYKLLFALSCTLSHNAKLKTSRVENVF